METDTQAEQSPRVSVVIPSYDRPDLVGEAVQSVDRQTVNDIEVIVVDDHSPTPVEEHLDTSRFETVTVRCHRHERNRGANAARNTGISKANGEFVGFLDDDDVWKPTFVERQLETFRQANDAVGVAYTGLEVVDDEGVIIGTFRPRVSGDVTKRLLCGDRIGSFSRLLVRRSVIESAGTPDERYPSWQDMEWLLRLSEHCAFAATDGLLVRRRVDHEQISDDFAEKRDVTYPLLLSEYRSLAAEYGWLTERRFMAATSATLASAAVQNEQYEGGRRYALIALAAYPFDPTAWLFLFLALGGDSLYKPARSLKRRFAERVPNP